jgi:hypothetical protein
MSAISDGSSPRADQIAAELGRCRQRGIDGLDRNAGPQRPVVAPGLDMMALRYARQLDPPVTGRTAQVKALLLAALRGFSASESEQDAALIGRLLFDDSILTVSDIETVRDIPKVRRAAGVLLKKTRLAAGEPSETVFRQQFQRAFDAFADFLVRFAPVTGSLPDGGREPEHGRRSTDAPQVAAGLLGTRPDRFIDLLANATEAMIVGFDNDLLEEALRAALELKRARQHDQGAFWSWLDVVFLSESLLDYLDDHAVSPDRRVAVRERRRIMTETRRSVRLLLRKTGCTEWTVADTPFLPAFAGSLFILPGSRHVVQLIVRQPAPRTRIADQVYFEFDDLPNEYFTKAFRRVVDRSISDNRPVPVGNAFGGTFVRRGTESVYRDEVLRPASNSPNWLPMVLVVTTQRKRGETAPMLQLRTEENAIREIDTISHLSRHIYQDEPSPLPGARAVSAPPSFDINSECAKRAAQLRVQMETGDDIAPELSPITTGQYVNPDTDNLLFFIYSFELPEETNFPPQSEMHRFTLQELLDIRAHQALRIAGELCRVTVTERPGRFWKTAVELATLNLALHHHDDIARSLEQLAEGGQEDLARLGTEIDGLIGSASPTRAPSGRQMQVAGLSGWQFREFFSVLVPQYAKVDVPGARDELGRISSGPAQAMLRRVANLYQDEDLLRSLPIEL